MKCNVNMHRATPAAGQGPTAIERGTILVSPHGEVRIVRSRTSDGTGWNCADGAAIHDDEVSDAERWTAYTPERLAAALAIAEDVRQLSGQRELAGGLATWDACSGRPCVLPKLARLVQRAGRDGQPIAGDWLAAID